MGLFNFFKTKKYTFTAQVSMVIKKTRFKSTIVLCTILEGQLNKNDTVVFLDKDKKVIAEGTVSVINYNQKSVPFIEKSDKDSNTIGLEFYNVCDTPIENTEFICKKSQ